MVVLLTPAAVGSRRVKREIEYALGAKNFSNCLISVVVGDRDQFPTNEIPWIVWQMPWFSLENPEADHPNVVLIAKGFSPKPNQH